MLAVEVLADGAALSQPKYVERLAALGMRLVDLPLDERLPQLARACMSDEDAAAAAVPVWMEGIRKKLDAGGVPEERIAAWGLLIALVDEGSEDARRLADERWAGDAAVEDGRALRRSRSPSGSSWLSDAVGRDVERFAPEVVLSPWSFGAGAQRVALMTLLAGHGSRKTAFVTDGDGAGLLMLLWHTLGRRSDGYGDLVRLEGRSPKWRLVKASAVLLMEPNRQRLAEVLQAIATVGLEAARDLPDGLFPWPVMACLNSAVTAADMERFASQAASGELGDAADWLALEDRVAQGQRLGLEEMRAHRWEEWPLDADLGSASMLPFVAARAISNGIRSAHLTADAAQHRSDQIAGLAARLHEPGISPQAARTLARVLPLLVEASHRLGAVPRLSPGDVRRISALAEQLPVSMLAAILPHISLESDWIDLLDDLGRSEKTASRAYFESGLAELLLDALNEAPDKTGLLRLLGRLATFAAIPGTGDWRIDPDRYSDPRDRDAALALQVLWGAVSESEARQARMFVSGGTEDFPAAELVRIVSRSPDLSLQRGLLEVLSTSIPRAEYDALDRLVHVARPLVGKVPSNLEDPAVWDSLQLPMPRPERRSPSDRAPASSGDRRPVAIERMAFRNFRGIEELQITPAPPQNGHGQWIVLLGKNGLGKTTILRGLALSLVEIDEPVRRPLPPTAYNAAWRRIGTPEEQPSFVRVKLRGGDHEHGAEIRAREDLLAQEQLAPLGKPPSEMVLVYGSHRRYVVSDAKRTVVEDVSALVPSLFEEGADLLPLEETLVKMAAAHLSEPGTTEARLHGELTAALAKLLRLQAVELRGQQIWVRGSDNVDVPLKELSDGYLTLAAWVVDLVARWWFQAKRWKIEPSGPILPFMTGVVLVDEIDLFLHPDWQRSVVRSLREIFPRMTFVVTTHNPLAILGARAAEIWILRKDDSGKAVAEQRDLEPFRLTGSDLYDFYFGIESALPDELGQMLRRYEQLAGDPYRSAAEDDEVRALLGKLRAKDVDPGWEPVALEAPPAAEGEGA
ncbi:MAG: AAA family ATPase [Polyangiaceae bacterium]